MAEIFLRIPTSKTSRISVYFNYVAYILRNLESILRYNGFNKSKDNLLLYRGKQKARAEKCNVLINGGKKYSKEGQKICHSCKTPSLIKIDSRRHAVLVCKNCRISISTLKLQDKELPAVFCRGIKLDTYLGRIEHDSHPCELRNLPT
ncbi:hypothetical protein EDC94DRAFT_589446 [Helicostylum pulchrum]|nr:hypothetical protein EDC94DRAFT_589446 [Helicostylum pulchrum]